MLQQAFPADSRSGLPITAIQCTDLGFRVKVYGLRSQQGDLLGAQGILIFLHHLFDNPLPPVAEDSFNFSIVSTERRLDNLRQRRREPAGYLLAPRANAIAAEIVI